MIDMLIYKQDTRSLSHQLTVTVFFFFLSAFLIASATVSPSEFAAASSGSHSPQIEIALPSLPAGSAALNTKITSLKEAGFGTLFLSSIPAGSNSWKRIAPVADCCRKNSMKLGCDFFPQDENTERLYRIVWTNRIIDAAEPGSDNKASVILPENDHLIYKFRIPLSYSNDVQRAFAPGYMEPATGEKCYEYIFKADPVEPHAINYLDKDVFERSVNQFLLNAQMFLRNDYGTVFDAVRFPSIDNSELVWTGNLANLFKRDLDFDLVHNLPVLALGQNSENLSIKNICQSYERAIKRFWIENFSENVRPLVHEAGLCAAISVNELPIPPEELGSFFRFPVAAGSSNLAQRVVNRRMSGGVRIYGSVPLNGRMPENDSFLGTGIDDLLIDGATRIIFRESILDCSFAETKFESLQALCGYVNRCSLILQDSEPAPGIFLCSKSIPESMNRFVFDSVTPAMLTDAEIAGGKISFPSGRNSPVIVFSDDVKRRNKVLINDLESSGVKVISCAEISRLMPDFSWQSEDVDLNLRFVRRTTVAGDIFMVKNESSFSGQADLIFKVDKFTKISRWQPQDGKVIPITDVTGISPAQCMIPTPIQAGELFFIVFDHESH